MSPTVRESRERRELRRLRARFAASGLESDPHAAALAEWAARMEREAGRRALSREPEGAPLFEFMGVRFGPGEEEA